MESIVLIGGGGHCKCVIDAIAGSFEIKAILDVKEKIGQRVLGLPIAGTDNKLENYFKKGIKLCFIAFGSIGYTKSREDVYKKAKKIGFKFPNIIHAKSCVSEHASLGEGNYIAAGAVINAGAKIGSQCIINTGAVIDHDCVISDFVHIAPGTALSGNVCVGFGTHIGTGASVIQNIKIGEGSIIGAGSAVIKDVPQKVVCCGNPARVIRE